MTVEPERKTLQKLRWNKQIKIKIPHTADKTITNHNKHVLLKTG
jgi:hypothetical protein